MSIPAFVTSTAAYLNDIGDFSNTNNKSNYITSLPTPDRLVWKSTADGTVTVSNNRFWDDTGATGIYSTAKTAKIHTPELWKEFWTNYYPLSQEEYNKNPEKYDKMFGDFLTDYVTRYILNESSFTPNSDRPKTKLFQNAISTDPAVYMKQFKAYLDTCGTPANPGPYGYTTPKINNTGETTALGTAKTNATTAINAEITYLGNMISSLKKLINSTGTSMDLSKSYTDIINSVIDYTNFKDRKISAPPLSDIIITDELLPSVFLSDIIASNGTTIVLNSTVKPSTSSVTSFNSTKNTIQYFNRELNSAVKPSTPYNELSNILTKIFNPKSELGKYLSNKYIYDKFADEYTEMRTNSTDFNGNSNYRIINSAIPPGTPLLRTISIRENSGFYKDNTADQIYNYNDYTYGPHAAIPLFKNQFKENVLDVQSPKAVAELNNVIASLTNKLNDLYAKKANTEAEYDARIAELKAQEKTTQVLTPSLALKATNSIAYVTQLLRKMYTSLQQTASTQADIISNYAASIEKGINTFKAYFKKKADALAATTAAPPQPKTGGGSVTEDEMKAYRKAMEQKGRYDTAYNSCETQLQIVGNTNKTYSSSLDATNNALTPASDLINSLITLRSSIMRALIGS